jgi:peptidoglycan hydrolase CwlO-like protein
MPTLLRVVFVGSAFVLTLVAQDFSMRMDISSLESKTRSIESDVSRTKSDISSLESKIRSLESKISSLESKDSDLDRKIDRETGSPVFHWLITAFLVLGVLALSQQVASSDELTTLSGRVDKLSSEVESLREQMADTEQDGESDEFDDDDFVDGGE